MVFGHNTNLKLGDATFHVQTEDRGEAHALIDTTVYFHGRVLHRRTNNYLDLLPINDDRARALKLRLDDQHRTVIEEIRSGALQLVIPQVSQPRREEQKPAVPPEPQKLLLELANAKTWLTGKHVRLQVSVKDEKGTAVPGVQVHAQLEGGEGGQIHSARTGPQGEALIEFEMPRVTGAEAALVISAEDVGATGHLRFAMRARPRVVSQ